MLRDFSQNTSLSASFALTISMVYPQFTRIQCYGNINCHRGKKRGAFTFHFFISKQFGIRYRPCRVLKKLDVPLARMFCAGCSAVLARRLTRRTVRMFVCVSGACLCTHRANVGAERAKIAMML